MADKTDDLNLPAAVVTRLIREAVSKLVKLVDSVGFLWFVGAPKLPEGANISKEARTAVSKAASVFVLYTTAW